jgi:hypothetical protein
MRLLQRLYGLRRFAGDISPIENITTVSLYSFGSTILRAMLLTASH